MRVSWAAYELFSQLSHLEIFCIKGILFFLVFFGGGVIDIKMCTVILLPEAMWFYKSITEKYDVQIITVFSGDKNAPQFSIAKFNKKKKKKSRTKMKVTFDL